MTWGGGRGGGVEGCEASCFVGDGFVRSEPAEEAEVSNVRPRPLFVRLLFACGRERATRAMDVRGSFFCLWF